MAKRIKLKDVAEKAGVSTAVASYILNDTPGRSVRKETRERILDAAKSLDYMPDSIAYGLRTNQSMTFALVSFWHITDEEFVHMLDGITEIASENSYSMMLCGIRAQKNEFDYVTMYKQRRIDGVILFAPPEGINDFFVESKHIEIIKNNKIPAVIIDGMTAEREINYTYVDRYATSKTAIQFLLEHGHKDIAYVLPDKIEINYIRTKERLVGYYDALEENGITVKQENIYTFEQKESLLERIKSGNGPSAVILNKSSYARRFLDAADKYGLSVPDDFSLIATNLSLHAVHTCPALAMVEIPLRLIGKISAEKLIAVINKSKDLPEYTIENIIRAGESVSVRRG